MHFKSGTFVTTPSGYKAFQPEKINQKFQFDESSLMTLLEEANLKLGELNAYSNLVPDVQHFIRLHVVKEATVSSRIEGTQTNLKEALLREEEINPEKRNDWREVNNYIDAMNNSIQSLEKLPLSGRLLKDSHAILLQGVRGMHKMPGEYRTSQNWIGGTNLNNAGFIPPVYDQINDLMGDLEKFLHSSNTGLPHVVKAALAHYQFETIHPFLDGNGRIGRLLITLYFIHAKILNKPVLYLSDFFEKNKNNYYDYLTAVRLKNDLKTWIAFFLTGIIETSKKAIKGLKNILELKKDCEQNRITTLGKKMSSAQKLLQASFIDPVIRPDRVASITGLSSVSSYKLIDDFVRLGILTQIGSESRSRIYIFKEYFEVFNK